MMAKHRLPVGKPRGVRRAVRLPVTTNTTWFGRYGQWGKKLLRHFQ